MQTQTTPPRSACIEFSMRHGYRNQRTMFDDSYSCPAGIRCNVFISKMYVVIREHDSYADKEFCWFFFFFGFFPYSSLISLLIHSSLSLPFSLIQSFPLFYLTTLENAVLLGFKNSNLATFDSYAEHIFFLDWWYRLKSNTLLWSEVDEKNSRNAEVFKTRNGCPVSISDL